MGIFKLIEIAGVLFLTTSSLCWVVTSDWDFNPILAMLLLLLGILVTSLWAAGMVDSD